MQFFSQLQRSLIEQATALARSPALTLTAVAAAAEEPPPQFLIEFLWEIRNYPNSLKIKGNANSNRVFRRIFSRFVRFRTLQQEQGTGHRRRATGSAAEHGDHFSQFRGCAC